MQRRFSTHPEEPIVEHTDAPALAPTAQSDTIGSIIDRNIASERDPVFTAQAITTTTRYNVVP